MEYIIWIIVIIIGVVVSESKKKQQREKRDVQMPGKPQWISQSARNTQQRPAQYTQQKPVQQRPTQYAQQKRSVPGNDILSRASANVTKNDRDELAYRMQTMAEAQRLADAVDIDETSECMREVEDLIIMGYQNNLRFARDFVGEGLDMLSSYELSTDI